jgi:putative aldouronate transport system substrate-binding protein
MRKRTLLLCFALVLLATQVFAIGNRQTATASNDIRQTMVMVWNGNQPRAGLDQYNNPVAQRLREVTGVTVEWTGTMINEVERLNLMFASGDTPDIISCANWGGLSGETQVLQRAGNQGRLLPLDDYLPRYPNIQRVYNIGVISQAYLDAELKHSMYNGKMYLIPQDVYGSPNDMSPTSYGVHVRDDVAKALGVDPTTIKTSQQLLDFMRRARDYGFRDVNGNRTLVAGNEGDGAHYPQFYHNFRERKLTEFVRNADGTVTHDYLTSAWVERNMFIWRLVNEGILDPECFRQTNDLGQTKIGNGTYLFIGWRLSSIITSTRNSGLYDAHPEMRYVPVGPLNYSGGEPGADLQPEGTYGTAVLAFPTTNRNLEASLRYIDYLNTIEGRTLQRYGFEGQTFVRNELGQPRMLPQDLANRDAGVSGWRDWLSNMGINATVGNRTNLAYLDKTWFGETSPGASPVAEVVAYERMRPVEQIPGYSIDGFSGDFPEIQAIGTLDDERSWRERAYFAPTEAEARNILLGYQNYLRTAQGGVFMRYMDYMTRMARTRPDVAF